MMEKYVVTNYSLCSRQTSYLETPDFLANGVHTFSILTFPLSIYGAYLILRVTPKHLEGTKYILFYLQFCTFLLDIIVNFLITPYLFLPLAAANFLGVLKNSFIPFKVLTFIGHYSIWTLGISILAVFQNRHSVIITIKHRITRTPTLIYYYVFLYIFGFIIILTYHSYTVDDIEQTKLEFLSKYPCPPPLFFESTTQFVTDKLYFAGFGILAMASVIFTNGFYFFLTTSYHLVFKSAAVSSKTKQLQLSFLISVSIQIAIPIIALFIPIVYLCYSIIQTVYSQIANNSVVLTISLHGLLSNLSLVLLHKPYRDFTFRRFEKRKSSTVVSVVI
ncbi:unnamed protein product [Caenorhabditis angaria]|uniref:Serpentine Receptor, class H n=1 Tax=Caenorhabditis angaria TaxID=860376 RepID=A0A9P1N4C9_9PELO|nr:unnamed protein product [Caenorhabditis angaria]